MSGVLSCVWQVLLDWFTDESHKVDAPEILQVGSMTAFPFTREFKVSSIARSGELENPCVEPQGPPEITKYLHVKSKKSLKTPSKRVRGQSRDEPIPTKSMMTPNDPSDKLPQKEGHSPTQTKLSERSLIIDARPLEPLNLTPCIAQEENWQDITRFDIEKSFKMEMNITKCVNNTVDIVSSLISHPLGCSTISNPDLLTQQSDPVIIEDIKPNVEQSSVPSVSISNWVKIPGKFPKKVDWKRLEERTNLSLKGVKETLGLETLWCENLDDDELPPIPQSWLSDITPDLDAEMTHTKRLRDDNIHFARPMPSRKKVVYNTCNRR
jgi:hypothetical protein